MKDGIVSVNEPSLCLAVLYTMSTQAGESFFQQHIPIWENKNSWSQFYSKCLRMTKLASTGSACAQRSKAGLGDTSQSHPEPHLWFSRPCCHAVLSAFQNKIKTQSYDSTEGPGGSRETYINFKDFLLSIHKTMYEYFLPNMRNTVLKTAVF